MKPRWRRRREQGYRESSLDLELRAWVPVPKGLTYFSVGWSTG